MSSPKKIAALVLAAGEGRRLDGTPKALLKRNRRSFLELTVSELRRALVEEIRIVTGAYRQEVEAEAARLEVPTTHNERFATGMHSSIRAGISALTSDWDGVLICLVDQPFLTAGDFRTLIAAFEASSHGLVRPVFEGLLGNPALISRAYRAEIEAEPDRDQGCAYLFRRHPDETIEVSMTGPACRIDIDRAQDYSQHIDDRASLNAGFAF